MGFIEKIRNNEQLTIFGEDKTLDFTYVDDCVSGTISGIEKIHSGELKNKTINLAFGEGKTLIQLAQMIGQELDIKPKMIVEDSRVGEVTHYVADISKAKKYLDYNPATNLNNGIKKAIKWQREYYGW